ncbi:dynamin family protein [Aspergillus puulaauensis]|uniref:Dynamin family protein n=1 Tax=Aspergillus puulaauensis TaxID=1220207 RepID=A0A7R7XTG7_9EURO|nr:uncharacterized protein APUU_60125A [Aspergillus puulaauensis]BCS27077.1 hypothetical protein APUU_60125A [Aspergillus puulaauensis]
MDFTKNPALRQLSGDHDKLLNALNDARSLGLHGLSDPPMLVVCGTRSSGKSSVLQAISRIPFPSAKDSSRCTQFATEVTLRRSNSPGTEASIVPGPSCTDPAERAKLRNSINADFSSRHTFGGVYAAAELRMGRFGPESSDDVTDHTLKLEVSGPDQPGLTLVDLPGLDFEPAEEDEESARLAKRLAKKYMASPRSIILLVVSAEAADDIDELLDMAHRFDGKGQRTLGIITRPDSLVPGSDGEASVLQLLRNEKMCLPLGWHVLKQCTEADDISYDTRDQKEKEFFGQGSWTSLLPDLLGAESLRRRLGGILFQYYERRLPPFVADMQKRISERQATLADLATPRSTIQSQRAYLLHIASGFERIANQAVDETYLDAYFDNLGKGMLRRVIRQLNELFADAMAIRGARRVIADDPAPFPLSQNPYLQSWTPQYITRLALETEACELVRHNYGSDSTGSSNRIVAGILFRNQAQPWEEVARMHLLNAWDAVKRFAFAALQHLTDDRTSVILARSVLEPALDKIKQDLIKKLTELILPTKRYVPLPMSKAVAADVEEARKTRLLHSLESTLIHENGDPDLFYMPTIKSAFFQMDAARHEFAAAEVVDHMQFYYDTAVPTFVDNVNNLAVENCLVNPLRGIFSAQVVNSMDDTRIQELAAEPPKVNEERDRLRNELDEFRAVIRALDVFRPLELSLEDLSMNTPEAPKSTESPISQKSQKTPTSSQDSTSKAGSDSHPSEVHLSRSDAPTPRPRKRVRPGTVASDDDELQYSGLNSSTASNGTTIGTYKVSEAFLAATATATATATHPDKTSELSAQLDEILRSKPAPARRTSILGKPPFTFTDSIYRNQRPEKRSRAELEQRDEVSSASASGIPVPVWSCARNFSSGVSESKWAPRR